MNRRILRNLPALRAGAFAVKFFMSGMLLGHKYKGRSVFGRPLLILLIFGITSLVLCSCNMSDGGRSDYPVRTFWAQNMKNSRFEQVQAELLAENDLCKVWAEKRSRVSVSAAEAVAGNFQNIIYPKMTDIFNIEFEYKYNDDIVARNTMEMAGWIAGGGDKKICILLLDIKDDYKKGVNNSYVAGYFWAGDLLPNNRYSNECAMIYIDTNPGEPGKLQSFRTIAHEMQHLMNFVTSIAIRAERNASGAITRYNDMDIWIDEGLSSAAEWLANEQHSEIRWGWYNEDQSGLIKNGNNFFVWGNRKDEHPNAVLDDYATVYLFFQWIRLQFGGSGLYSEIAASGYSDYRAVTGAAGKHSSGFVDWETLLRSWLAANHFNAETGIYGYMNEPDLNLIRAKTPPEGIKSVDLAPGEGVYSKSKTRELLPHAEAGSNIKYAALKSYGDIADDFIDPEETLLTYNANTDNRGYMELGITTGYADIGTTPEDENADIELDQTAIPPGRRIQNPLLSGPFPIGARDLPEQRGAGTDE
jgi:hypothetical protein